MPIPIQFRACLDPALQVIPVLAAAPLSEFAASLRSQAGLHVGDRPADGRPGVRLCAVSIGLAAALSSALAIAQSSSTSYQVPRQSIDGGKARASSAGYAVEGTIGQPDVAASMTSASYQLRGGFHRAVGVLPDPLFSNGFE